MSSRMLTGARGGGLGVALLLGLLGPGCVRGGFGPADLAGAGDAQDQNSGSLSDSTAAEGLTDALAAGRWEQVQFSIPERLAALNSPARDRSVSLSPDRLILYLASNRPAVAGQYDLLLARRASPSAEFAAPIFLTELNTDQAEWSATVSPSQLEVILARAVVNNTHIDLWRAVRQSPAQPFGPALPLDELNSGENDLWPTLGPDPLQLFFVSLRAGGLGLTDIWQATRSSLDAPFSSPTPVVSLSSSADDWEVTLSLDGRAAIIASNRPGTLGQADLWLASRPTSSGPFATPVALTALNSAYDEADPVLSADATELFFCSDRPGGSGSWDIYKVDLFFP